MDSIYVYYRYVEVSVRSQMQYRASHTFQTIGHLLVTAIELLAIVALFERFGSLKGWSLPEVALMYGIVNIAFAFADAATRGFDQFGTMVRSGDFDRLLLRPRTTALQLAGRELTLKRIGRLTQGLVVLLWAAAELGVDWTPLKVGLTLEAIIGGAALFSGLIVLQATLAFWTTETLEIMNALTYGGVATAQYPLVIYLPWFRRLFTYVVPLAAVSYFPAIAILGRPDPLGSSVLFQYLSPLIGIGFLVVTLQVWKFGVRHYLSTGS